MILPAINILKSFDLQRQVINLRTNLLSPWMNYCLTTSHLLLTAFLMFSSLAYSGDKWLSIFFFYILCYTLVAYGFHKRIENFVGKLSLDLSAAKSLATIVNRIALCVLFAFPIIYFFAMKTIPIWNVMLNNDFYGIARFRSSLSYDAPKWIDYCVEYSLKGLAPFYLLFLYHTRSKWFYTVFAFTWFFALNMIAKAYVVIILLPLLIYQLEKKQWRGSLKTALVIVFSVSLLVYLENPQAWPRPWHTHAQQQNIYIPGQKAAMPEIPELLTGIAGTVYNRLIIVPGKVTDEWLSIIPGQRPFLLGCGYKKLASLLGCDYVRMPEVVFAAVYPEMLGDQGYRGSITASNLINDYVNFGYLGLMFPAFLIALLLASLEGFSRDRAVLLALNIAPLILLTETTLTSVLHTGGMFLVNFLYFINRDRFLNSAICCRIEKDRLEVE